MHNSITHPFIASMHVDSRLFAGTSFLLTAAINDNAVVAIIQLFFFIIALVHLKQGYLALRRSLNVLRWLVIPIIILHAFFTPGELVLSGTALPISVEGVKAGVWFALHLTVIFFSAILFSRLLTKREWIAFVLRLPRVGEKVLPFVLLMETGWSKTKDMLHAEHQMWRRQKAGIGSFIVHVASLPVKSLQQSHAHAKEVWNSWEISAAAIEDPGSTRQISFVATATALTCGMLMWSVLLTGGA